MVDLSMHNQDDEDVMEESLEALHGPTSFEHEKSFFFFFFVCGWIGWIGVEKRRRRDTGTYDGYCVRVCVCVCVSEVFVMCVCVCVCNCYVNSNNNNKTE